MFYYWYKGKLVGPFPKDVSHEYKQGIKRFIDDGHLDFMEDQFPIKGAEYNELYIITKPQ